MTPYTGPPTLDEEGEWYYPFLYDSASKADGTSLDICGYCRTPCCPSCECIAGEMYVCTRCTKYPDCDHSQS